MKQYNQIGKYVKKDEVLNAKRGRVFVTPKNRNYTFDYRKEGRKYIFIISHNGYRMQMSESDYNRNDIDTLIDVMLNEINKDNE